MALTVKSRRDRSSLDVVGVDDVRLARVLAVGLGPVGRDLEDRVALAGADRAERLALRPHRVGPAVEERHRLLGPGVGGQVEVGPGVTRPSTRSRTIPPTR